MKIKYSKRWKYFLVAFSSMLCSVGILFTANAFQPQNKVSLTQQGGNITVKLKDGRRLINIADTSEISDADGNYQIRVGSNVYSRTRKSSKLIQLQGGKSFDPLQMENFISSQQKSTLAPSLYNPGNSDIDAYIVQFHTQALPDYQQALRNAGAVSAIGLPPNAIIVLMNTSNKTKIKSLPFVRAVVEFLPAYKLQDGLEAVIASGSTDSQLYSIMSVTKAHRDDLVNFTQSIGGEVIGGEVIGGEVIGSDASLPQSQGSRFTAELTADQLHQVSQRAETLFIDLRGEEGEDLDQVREREGFNHIETVAGYCGQGVGFEVYDRGYLLSHQELVNKPILVRSPAASSGSGGFNHGTEIAGIMYAQGVAMVKGLIHCAARPIVFSRFSGFPSNNQPTEAELRGHLAELVDPSGPYRAIAQTSSTDYARTLSYTTWSAEYDEVLFELDFIKLQSQSNAGNRDSRPAAWAKNTIAVGGFHTANTVDRSDDFWERASIGPAADNRIKPDLTGQYGGIRTTDDVNNTAYTDFGGTSGATPTVGGAFAIMFQMWADGVFDGGPGKNRDVFNARPHASTAKALMIHSAFQYAFSGGDSANLSRVHQGWGAPDLKNLYETAKVNGWGLPILVNEDDIVTPGTSNSYTLTVDGTQPLKTTMVYRDLRGNPAAAIHRINDLSLKVTSPSGTIYWGNNGLRSGNWSTPGGTSNTVDTVENVFIQAPEAGTWNIEVLGDDIVQDGHPTTGATDAVYALLATGGNSAPPGNRAPNVNAGPDQSILLSNTATLNGTVSDDGLPVGSSVTTQWSKVSGPGTVTFSNASATSTTASFSAVGTYVLRLSASDTALSSSDNVTVTVTDGTEPPVVLETQNFENSQGNWVNVTAGDNEDWTRDQNGTPSNGTGPSSGSNGSQWYMYLETSNGSGAFNAGDSAILQGPTITGSARTLTFDYHMFGSNMGTLNVDVNSGGVWTENVHSITGQQHSSNSAPYSQATVDLGAFSGTIQVRFRAVAAGGFRGDMAIDNIEITGIGGAAQ